MYRQHRIFFSGLFFLFVSVAAFAQLTFQRCPTPLGPVGISKFVSSGTTVFALSPDRDRGGYRIYRSADNGVNWSLDSTHLVYELIAWGTGNVLALNANRVFRSTDNGLHWTSDTCDFYDTPFLNTLVRTTTGTLLAYGADTVAGNTLCYLYRSTNNGSHWAACYDSLQPIEALANVVMPTGTVYSMTKVYLDSNDYMGSINIRISMNDGASWLTDTTMRIMELNDTYAGMPIGLAVGMDSSVYAITDQEIFRKQYRGVYWNQIGFGHLNMSGYGAMAITPRDELMLTYSSYYGNSGIYRSSDYGAHWVRDTTHSIPGFNVMYFANGCGFSSGNSHYRSTDRGVSWSPVTIGSIELGLQYNYSAGISGTILGSRSRCGNNNFLSTDRGAHWQDLASRLTVNGYFISSIYVHHDSVLSAAVMKYDDYASNRNFHGIVRSTNNGQTWITTFLDTNSYGISPFQAGVNGSVVIATNHKYVSYNSGSTWHIHPLLDLIPYTRVFIALSNNTYLAFTDSSGYTQNRFYSGSDSSTHWTFLSDAPAHINGLYQTRSGAVLADYDNGRSAPHYHNIFRSIDLGHTWTTILPTATQQAIFPMASNVTGDLFSFDSTGRICRSIDEGLTWQRVTPDLLHASDIYYSQLTVDRDGYLYFLDPNVYPYTFYRTTTSTVGVRELQWVAIPASPMLNQNYPNPFNSTTRISFSLPNRENTSLTIYDVMGRKVTTLLNREPIAAGAHSVEWNAEAMPSGIYFYRLSSGKQVSTQKMILLK